jgi:hypothetical protein
MASDDCPQLYPSDALVTAALLENFPAWGIWRPKGGHWIAARPLNSPIVTPRETLVWAQGWSSGELAMHMAVIEGKIVHSQEQSSSMLARFLRTLFNSLSQFRKE